MKKKRKKRKNKSFSKKQLEKLCVSVFKENPSKSLNYKQVSKILGVRNSSERSLISVILSSLTDSGIIKEDKRGRYKTVVSTKKIIGSVSFVSNDGVRLTSENVSEEIFIPLEFSLFSLKSDVVEAVVFPKKKGGLVGEIVRVIERKKTEFVGVLEKSKGFGFLVPEGGVPFDIFIPNSEISPLVLNKKIVVRVSKWDPSQKNPVGKISKVLGKVNDHDAEMVSFLYRYGLSPFFPKEVEKEASSSLLKIPSSEIKKRSDFRKTTTFTIDPDDAKDYDDALSVKELKDNSWEIGVHIADVGFYVKENGVLDKEAFSRSTSVYLVDRVFPMIPDILSNNLCSLKEGEDRLCFSVILKVNRSLDVVSSEIKKTIINSNKRFTYEEAQKILDNKKGLFSKEMLVLSAISKKLRKKRFSSGSINFEREEVKFILDKNNNPTGVYIKPVLETNHLIEEFMLLSNKVVSEKIGGVSSVKTKKPFVYRVHDVPDKEKIISLNKVVKQFGYSIDISSTKNLSSSLNSLLKKSSLKKENNLIKTLSIRSMSKAFYSTNNIGHYGLGFRFYSHFTSPIRRYPDLIVHRLLDKYLSNKNHISKNEIEEICKHCSIKEKDSQMAERDSVKYMQSRFLKDKIGNSFYGVISGVKEWGVYVEIEDNHCEGLVKISSIKDDYYIFDEKTHSIIGTRKKNKYQLGDRVKIKISNVDTIKNQIDFILV